MIKGLEALKYISKQLGTNLVNNDYLQTIEKELKALEIIRRLPSDYVCDLLGVFRSFKDYTFGDFISWGGDETPILINEEEYDLLKEVLNFAVSKCELPLKGEKQ